MRGRSFLRLYFCFLLAVLSCSLPAFSGIQRNKPGHKSGNVDKVKDLVNFLQFTLNTVGNPQTTAREKDVIITQSYLKLFRDPKVQIEDDLDASRQVVTNKDVQAYLKDVDFFFKSAHFSLDIQGIDSLMNEKDEKVYVVKLNRNLNAITIDDDTINQNITRFVEINLNAKTEDLKIVSYYSTKLSEEEDLTNWWKGLTFEWKLYFKNKLGLQDSVVLDDIRKIIEVDSVDISDNPYITSIEPLSKCEKLEYLNISNTYVVDLASLRYLSKLKTINISGTKVTEISFLHYSMGLQDLNLAGTLVNDFGTLSEFPSLKKLDLSNTQISRLSLLNQNSSLNRLILTGTKIISLDSLNPKNAVRYLDISGTGIESLKPLSAWPGLEELVMERTVIDDLSPLASLTKLQVLNCESTNVSDLTPLQEVKSLKKIYCDNSGITKELANRFNTQRPDVLLIFESQELAKWWSSLSSYWQDAMMKAAGLVKAEGKDELARIVNIDSLSICDSREFTDLKPLSEFTNLKYLDCHNTGISDLSPLEKSEDLKTLDISQTAVTNLDVLHGLKKIIWLNIEKTQVTDLSPVRDLRTIKILIGDNTAVPEEQFHEIALQNPGSILIYRTDSLQNWWDALNDDWKSVFRSNAGEKPDVKIDKWFLHRVGRLEHIKIDSADIHDLKPLEMLDFLNSLVIENTPLSDISAVAVLSSLHLLKINRCPVIDFLPLDKCTGLTELDLGNTGLDDLSALEDLTGLKKLNVSGTRINKIKAVESMTMLEQLDISNTKVSSLKTLYFLYDLKMLICFNTRLNSKDISSFKANQPSCEVVYY